MAPHHQASMCRAPAIVCRRLDQQMSPWSIRTFLPAAISLTIRTAQRSQDLLGSSPMDSTPPLYFPPQASLAPHQALLALPPETLAVCPLSVSSPCWHLLGQYLAMSTNNPPPHTHTYTRIRTHTQGLQRFHAVHMPLSIHQATTHSSHGHMGAMC